MKSKKNRQCVHWRYDMKESEFCCLRCSWEGYDVTNVLHTRNEEDKPLKSQSKSAMRTCSIFACVEIPPHILHGDTASVDFRHQFVIILFTHTSSYDFSDLREEHIRALHGLTILIDFHIEGFDVLGIVGHDNRFLEMLFNEEALVF